MKTQKQVRANFWAYLKEVAPQYLKEYKASKKQNDYNTDIRTTFVDYVNALRIDGVISEKLAYKVTL
jgi:hypothetical protein